MIYMKFNEMEKYENYEEIEKKLFNIAQIISNNMNEKEQE